MNGQNAKLPTWVGMSLRVGGVIVAGTLAFAMLSAQVTATDLIAEDNKVKIEKHEERIDAMERVQIETVVLLKNMKETLDEISEDVKEHVKSTP